MTYSPMLIVHICGGLIGVLSGFTAMFTRKGGRVHRLSGDVFVVSMLFMAAGGAFIALIKSQPANVMAGTSTFYLVASAWLTVKRPAGTTGQMERGLFLLALGAALVSLTLGFSTRSRVLTIMFLVFGILTMLCAAGDLRLILRGGIMGSQRLVRHLWRMGLALFVATASFFIGTAGDPVMHKYGLRATLFTAAVRKTHLPTIPVYLVVILTIFWVLRVKFSRKYQTKPAPAAAQGPYRRD